MKARLRLALDHNFPRPIIDVVMKLVPEADLLPLQTFDDGGMLATLPDWKLLVALHRKPDVHGLVSMDEDFKSKPKDLVTLRQTRLSAVVVSGVGHDPVRAVGLVLHKLTTSSPVDSSMPSPSGRSLDEPQRVRVLPA